MATIAEMDANMTIFYYKSTGNLYNCFSGIQNKDLIFGVNTTDLSTIIDNVVLPVDNYFLQNTKLFKIDITKSPVILALRPVIVENIYPVATS